MAGHGLITEAKKGLGYPRTVAHNEKINKDVNGVKCFNVSNINLLSTFTAREVLRASKITTHKGTSTSVHYTSKITD